MTTPHRNEIEAHYRALQTELCDAFASADGTAEFGVDAWDRPGGGGGITRVLADGAVFEKGAINFSAVWGEVPAGLTESRAAQAGTFYASGVSMILHPRNPHVPTMHANVRYFETDGQGAWFGGGIDLTPYYLYEDDVRHFHRVVADVCAKHPVADYPAWKRRCDEYFFLPHRGEARGVGGIFFDHLADRLDEVWAFQQDLGAAIADAYLPIVERRAATPFDEAQERWHLQRRGRYVEFNLVYDRGTRFGLDTGGRTESILVSMPPRARWDYAAEPDPGTPEHELLELLRGKPRDWV